MATLNLPTSHRTNVWRVIKAAIEADTTYPDAGFALQFFDGSSEVLSDTDQQAPVLQIEPRLSRQEWFTEGSQAGLLEIVITAVVPGYDVEDTFNLQDALEATLNTIDDPGGLQASLVSARATTGLINFVQPLAPRPGPTAADGLFRLQGRFTVEVERPLNPA